MTPTNLFHLFLNIYRQWGCQTLNLDVGNWATKWLDDLIICHFWSFEELRVFINWIYFFLGLQTALPNVFQTLQELDDKRIKQIENFIRKGVDIERSVFPIINKCLDGIIRAADSVDPEKVTWFSLKKKLKTCH